MMNRRKKMEAEESRVRGLHAADNGRTDGQRRGAAFCCRVSHTRRPCLAFAILISAIVEAKEGAPANGGGMISNYHAAIILDLSWMNNTSTFIWFLLHAHHRSKENDQEIIPATWSAWKKHLLEPLRHLRSGDEPKAVEHNRIEKSK